MEIPGYQQQSSHFSVANQITHNNPAFLSQHNEQNNFEHVGHQQHGLYNQNDAVQNQNPNVYLYKPENIVGQQQSVYRNECLYDCSSVQQNHNG